jgi:hypothetical protein
MMPGWIIAAFFVAVLGGGLAWLGCRDRRRRAAGSGSPIGRSGAARRDPLHREATHYLASGALPRWDP